jgi:hypothetical protein
VIVLDSHTPNSAHTMVHTPSEHPPVHWLGHSFVPGGVGSSPQARSDESPLDDPLSDEPQANAAATAAQSIIDERAQRMGRASATNMKPG